jgi:hypothetical protein
VPHAELHQRQRRKNWMLLAILVGFAALFFSITVLKMTGN